MSLKKEETKKKGKTRKKKKAIKLMTLGDLFDEAVENTINNEEFMKYAATKKRYRLYRY